MDEWFTVFLLQVLVPAMEKKYGSKMSVAELCEKEDVKKLILEDMIATGKESGLFSFEQVR